MPISDGLAPVLGAWAEESVTVLGRPADGWVWPGPSGDRLRTRAIWKTIKLAIERAGLVDEDQRPVVTAHGLRHTCGSMLLARGVPLIVVSRHLEHRDAKVTADVYAHLLDVDAQLEAAARAFEGLSVTGTVRGAVRDTASVDETPMDEAIPARG